MLRARAPVFRRRGPRPGPAISVSTLEDAAPFVMLDGSSFRELAGPSISQTVHQSVAELTVPVDGVTSEHYHRTAEEVYVFTHGSGRLQLGDQECEVSAGDAVTIPPRVAHRIWNTGAEPLRVLSCCAPAYSFDDTVVTEQ